MEGAPTAIRELGGGFDTATENGVGIRKLHDRHISGNPHNDMISNERDIRDQYEISQKHFSIRRTLTHQ